MAEYKLKYYAEIKNFRGQLARVEILQRSRVAFSVLQIGDVCGLVLEIQGGQDDIYAPIVKTQARLSMVSCEDKQTAGGVKYGDWGEFYTPDSTLYKMVIKTRQSEAESAWLTRWSGYITPDSWQEGLEYRGVITITARDNIGHLQDFEFDMDGGDAYGLVSIRDVLAAAMAKIELPMDYEDASAPAAPAADGVEMLDAMVAIQKLQGSDWYTVVEGLLDSIGYAMRFTDCNRVTVAPLRYLPLLGEMSKGSQPSMSKLNFYGGIGEMVPAVKMITDTHSYDYAGAVGVAVFGHMSYGANDTYRCAVEGNTMPSGGKFRVPEHDAPTNKVTDPKGTAWVAGSDILNQGRIQGVVWSNSDDETLYSQYVLLPANSVEDTKPRQTLEFFCKSTGITIEAIFAENPISIKTTGGSFLACHEGHTLALISYELMYTKDGQTQYWDGYGWRTNATTNKVEFDSQNGKATSLKITLEPCDMGEGGVMRFSFVDIQYKCFYPYAYSGVYARLSSFQVSVNNDNLVRNTVRTINSDQYNVLLNRQPYFAPLSRDVSMVTPANYPTALYYYPAGESYPAQYPYQGNWDNLNTSVVKPLPVLIHQQILAYRGASLWELSGECAPQDGELFRFNSLPRYKERTYVLMSGTLDFLSGNVSGAILREFLNYDDIWDDTEQGEWSDASEYVRDGAAPVTTYGGTAGSGSGGSGVNYFEEDGQGGIKLKDDYNGLWAKGYGQNSSGGEGGGGVDLDRVWDSLTNNTDKPNVKINVAHIPNLEIGNINGLTEALAAAGGAKSLTVGNVNYQPDANGIISIPAYPDTSRFLTEITATMINNALGFTLAGAQGGAYNLATIASNALNGATAYNWGNHANAGYLTAVPKATNSVIGGFQTGYSESGKNYAVQMSGDKAFVNVPWTDTVYTHPTNGANTTISAANGKVLSAITVNNLGHVTSVSSKTLAAADIPDLSGVYLPLTGGTLTGDLRLKTGGTAYGSKLNIGDGDYVYLHEDTDDHLKMYASKGFEIATSGDSYGIKFGDGVLKWDSTNQAWHLEGNFYADGFVTAGGLGSENTQLVTLGGTQTITGAKTFTGTLTISGTGNTFTTAVTFQQHVTFGTINVGSISFNGSGATPGITNTLDRIYIQRTGQTGVSMCAANGMVVIGALSAGSGVTTPKLYVAGDALATGSWNTSSDRRLKDEIEAVYSDRALAVLMQLKPREWVWNENNEAMCGKRGAGFIAQDVLEVLPWAVMADGGYMGLNYQALHAYEVAGLQNHEERIAELERRLNNGA